MIFSYARLSAHGLFRWVLLLLAVFAAVSPAATQSFKNPRTISAAGFPQYCCVVDVNGDGKPDLVGLSGSTLTVQLNNGTGVFTVAQTLTVSPLPTAPVLQVKDVNRDGRPDLVIVGGSGDGGGFRVLTLLGNGDGTFQTPIVSLLYVSGTGGNPYFSSGIPAFGDFNSDGAIDMLLSGSSPTTSLINVLALGDGAGHFTVKSPNLASGGSRLFAGDFNGDGKLDYLSSSYQYGLSGNSQGTAVFLGNGDGTFRAGQVLNGSSYQAIMADVDGDGRPDFLYGTATGVNVFLGQADGTFVLSSLTLPGATGVFAVADVNGDGIPDLLTTYRGLSVLLGQGGLHFAAPVSTATQGGTFAWGTKGPFATSVVDLDGDGIPDLIDPETGRYEFYKGKGDGTFRSADLYPLGEQVGGVVLGDFNNDGKLDIAASVLAPYPRLLLGDGKGGFTANVDQNAGAAATTVSNSIVAGDFNGDGKLDVLMAGTAYGTSGNLGVSFGRGDGTFQPAVPLGFGSLVVGDFNGDGRSDMVTASYNNNTYGVTVSLGQANGTFTNVTSQPIGLDYGLLGVLDVNKDGKPDVFLTGRANVQELLGAGDGTFNTLVNLGDLGGPYYPSQFHTADLDGDGYPDVILETYAGAQIFYGLPGGKFAAPVTLAAGTGIRIADVDLDGKLDLIGVSNGVLQVLHNLGNRVFGNAELYVAGPAPNNIEVADVNGDGYPDIVAGNGSTDTVTVLLNLGPAGATAGKLQVSPEPSQYNRPLTLTYSVAGVGSTQVPTGTVACDIDGSSIGTITLVNGAGTLTVTTTVQAGSRTVTCRYPGDTTFRGSSISVPHTIIYTQVPVALKLTATPATALRSQTVRLFATATATAGVPYGNIAFYDGTTYLGASSLDSAGTSLLDTNLLTVGTHSITASYAGLSNIYSQSAFVAATSSPVTVTINAHATATILTLSSTGGPAGSPVTLTAKVTTTDGSTPFGSVTFFDGPSTLGTTLLTAGSSTWNTAFSIAGSHTLTATFLPNETFSSSAGTASTYRASVMPGTSPAVVALSSQGLASGDLLLQASLLPDAGTSHSISFFDGGLYLGSASSRPDGTTSLRVPGTAATHHYSAVVVADAALGSASSPDLEQTDTTPPTFALTLDSSAVTITPAAPHLVSIQLSSTAPAIVLTCTSTVPEILCDADAGRGLLIAARPPLAQNQHYPGRTVLLAFSITVFCGFRLRRKYSLRLVLPLLALCFLVALSGCTGVQTTPTAGVVTVQAYAALPSGTTAIHSEQVLVMLQR